MRRNPLKPLAENTRRQARLDALRAADVTLEQTPAGTGPQNAGCNDGNGNWQAYGRLGFDTLGGTLRVGS